MTLGNAAAARVRLIVWCLYCRHQVRPDPAEMAERLRGRDDRPGLASAACVRQLWEPAGRFRRYRDRAIAEARPRLCEAANAAFAKVAVQRPQPRRNS
jgi:hypothetical protein